MKTLCLLTAAVMLGFAACVDAETPPVQTTAPTPQTDAAPAPGVTIAPDVDALLDRLEAKADEVVTLAGRIRYDRIQHVLGDEQRRFGELTYLAGPPARFAVHLDKLVVDGAAIKQDRWWIFDGRWLLERNHDDQVATRRELTPEGEDAQLMRLGEGPFILPLNHQKQEIVQRFHVELAAPSEEDPKDTLHLKLTPKHKDQLNVERIDLWYDAATLLPRRAASLDGDGNESRFDLFKPELNGDVDNKGFNTELPRTQGWETQEVRLADTPAQSGG